MPYLPQETIDSIIDLLRGDSGALRQCCLTSKSWVSLTRKHLFNCVFFSDPGDFRVWKETFPDPASSPAGYTSDLSFCRAKFIDEDVNWIRRFTNVERLEVRIVWHDHDSEFNPNGPLSPFLEFPSDNVKSLVVGWNSLPLQEVFNFICSFPHLEDLHIAGGTCINNKVYQPSLLPVFTGTFELMTFGGGPVAHQLSEMGNRCRFRKIVQRRDLHPTHNIDGLAVLVERCSDTLEYLYTNGCCTSARWCPFISTIDLTSDCVSIRSLSN